MHLAALSNDPLGDLAPDVTHAVNHHASVALAEAAREAGVPRFIYSSSCSTYGAGDVDAPLDEHAPFNPVTPYGESKVLAERDIAALATDTFSPVFLRNATAYGVSPACAATSWSTTSSPTPTPPARCGCSPTARRGARSPTSRTSRAAFVAALEAPRDAVHNEAFNIGRDEDNHQIRDIARMVEAAVPDATAHARPRRRPRQALLPRRLLEVGAALHPEVDRAAGHRGDPRRVRRHAADARAVPLPRFQRIGRLLELVEAGELDAELRRRVRA